MGHKKVQLLGTFVPVLLKCFHVYSDFDRILLGKGKTFLHREINAMQ
jgi:hypothetical protein